MDLKGDAVDDIFASTQGRKPKICSKEPKISQIRWSVHRSVGQADCYCSNRAMVEPKPLTLSEPRASLCPLTVTILTVAFVVSA
jgi:hypothetical protein